MKTRLLILCLLTYALVKAAPPSIGGYNVYYGHLHNHTIYSGGAGTPSQAYSYAKNTAKLDFFGLSDHDTEIDSLEWVDTKAQADTFNQDGVFTTFYGFEWSYYGTYGHVTVVNTPDYTTYIATNTFKNLETWLSTRNGIAFFNHPGRENLYGREFDHFTDTPSDKFVGMELWNKGDGFSTYYYNDGYTPNDNSKGYYDEALSLGWKIGASGSSDNHSATWGTSEDYRMAILSNNLTRNDLLQAMQARRFYSTMDKNLALSFKINNQEMGSTVIPGTYTFQIQASDADNEVFTDVKLFDKSHNVVQTWSPNSTNVNVSTSLNAADGNYYYVKVTEADGGEAISSPIWIEAPPVADTQAPTSFTATLGTVTSNSVELLLNATDNSGAITYTVSYGSAPVTVNATGISETQKSIIITGLASSTNYTFSVTAKDASSNPAANNPIAIAARTTATVQFAVTSSPSAAASYPVAYLTDGNSTTNWKVLSPHASFITFEYSVPKTFNKMALTATTDDAPSRDPKNWTIKASNDTLAGWTVLDTRTGEAFATRGLTKNYPFTNSTPYRFYRLHITESNYSTTSTMLGEMAFSGDTIVLDTQLPTAFTVTKGAVTSNSVELLLNATDNSGTINYTISYGTGPTVVSTTGVSATQKSYIVTGLTPETIYSFTVTAKDPSANPAANNPIVMNANTASVSLPALVVTSSPSTVTPYSVAYLTDANITTNWKVLSPHASFITFEYAVPKIFNKMALTATTDDAPSRDPKNWTVKASNDTLAGWTVLDTRAGEAFATRGLTKNYSFTNSTPYRFYRLHITESNYSTTSTMLGEMAFSGDTIVLDTQLPTAFTVTKGAVTSNSVELLLNATDNSGTINYTISYGTGPTVVSTTGVSATQKSYIVTGLTPETAYSFTITAKDPSANPAANNPVVLNANTASVSLPALVVTSSPSTVTPYSVAYLTDANISTNWKVLSPHASFITFEYAVPKTFNKMALTATTDDAPSRDPKNWTVKASNDTLAGWTVLDTRTGEAFATRGLTKNYSFTNSTPYRFYRLHITESNYSTTSTMLGEMAFASDSIALAKVGQVLLNDSLGMKTITIVDRQLNIYYSNQTLFVQNLNDRKGILYLYDVYGRLILKQPFSNNEITSISLNLPASLYVAIGISETEKVTRAFILR